MALLAFEKAPFSAIFFPEVRAEVEAYRRGNLDQAVGRRKVAPPAAVREPNPDYSHPRIQ